MNTQLNKALGVSVVALTVLTGNAFGQWIGPGSAPGGNTWSGAGISPAHAGGKTWTAETFDLGASQDLYYGVDSDYYPALGINGLDPSLTFSLADSDLANGKSVWTGSVTIPLAVGGPTTTRDARFTLSVTDLNDIALAMVDSSTLSVIGIPTVQQGVLHVTDPAGFKANMLFEIADGPGYDAALAVYDALPTVQGNQMWSSVGGAFYAVIPEPAVLSMISLVGGGVWFIRRRFVI
jgi:hypothetical protein